MSETSLFQRGKINYQEGNHKEALQDFIECFNDTGDREVEEFILDKYYKPMESEIQQRYEDNYRSLADYSYFFGDEKIPFSQLKMKLIWSDSMDFVIFNQNKFMIIQKNNLKELGTINLKTPFIQGFFTKEDLLKLIQLKQEVVLINQKRPIYLYFEPEELEIYLMAEDIRALLEAERIVFFEGEEQFWDFFQKDKGLPPTIFYGENYQYFKEKWENLYILRNLHCSVQKRNLELYYLENDESIRERIKSGKFKILFITSLFTTILQYHTRDLALEAEKLGCSVKILTEEMPIEMMPPTRVCQAVEEFRPDMVFSIDHFRYEFNLPSSLRWGCWIQDPMSHIMNPLSIEKMEKRDLILNHFTTWGKFLALGYGERCTMIDAPIPANEEVYMPYELSDEEWTRYGADLCLVCHASDDEKLLKDSKGNSEVADVLVQYICNAYKESVYQWGEFLYTKEEFFLFIQEKLRELDITDEENGFVEPLSLFMFDEYNQRIYRITLVQWLIDAGYTNIKLWGNGWMENEKFKPYAMGPAENGEELSKIYQASKINIGNNIMTTAAARAWECMLSGGFYLSNWIPEEADITDIRRIVKLGEDVDFFRTKEEFLQKIDFYLTHEEARRKMIEKGRAISLDKMTYKKLMERIMDTLKEKCNEEGYN